jgi:hypothetical protein
MLPHHGAFVISIIGRQIYDHIASVQNTVKQNLPDREKAIDIEMQKW